MCSLQIRQLNTADRCLHLKHAPVSSKAFMEPTESRWVLTFIDSFVTLAVVFVRPSSSPCRLIVHCQEAAFASGGNNLVLAETECCEVTEAPYGSTVEFGAVSLGGIF